MLVTGENLSGVVAAAKICPKELIEEYSLGIRLDSQIRRMHSTPKISDPIVYGTAYQSENYFSPLETVERDIGLNPGDRILACSSDFYNMPVSYFGLVQTKGSLARLFISATCNDGQIEPGYSGKITLELANFSNFKVAIPIRITIAQLFVFRCTTASKPYAGRYQNAKSPTLADFSNG